MQHTARCKNGGAHDDVDLANVERCVVGVVDAQAHVLAVLTTSIRVDVGAVDGTARGANRQTRQAVAHRDCVRLEPLSVPWLVVDGHTVNVVGRIKLIRERVDLVDVGRVAQVGGVSTTVLIRGRRDVAVMATARRL